MKKKTIGNILRELKKNFKNILVIDDGSSDKSKEIALKEGFCYFPWILQR
jgi:hypothetical protein